MIVLQSEDMPGKRTRFVAILRNAGTERIVAAAAWKNPNAAYRREKFAKADAPITSFEAAPELGYVVIAPDMQGKHLSCRLVTAITEKIAEPTFATTDSNTMCNNLTRSGFTIRNFFRTLDCSRENILVFR